MKNLEYIVRDNPKLKIILKRNYFVVENKEYEDENGIFFLEKIKNLKLVKPKINWFLTIFSFLFEWFAFDIMGDTHKNIPKITFEYEGTKKGITLNDCEKKNYEELFSKLKSKLETKPNT